MFLLILPKKMEMRNNLTDIWIEKLPPMSSTVANPGHLTALSKN
jgi:hypothetical protein